MTPAMKYRYPRIAFSALCGVLCLLLVVLWVRSYATCDVLFAQRQRNAPRPGIVSFDGRIHAFLRSQNAGWRQQRLSFPAAEVSFTNGVFLTNKGSFRINSGGAVVASYWLAATIFATIGIMSWVSPSWRFSLRTLLIATTLVAVVLGLIVYASR